MRQRRIATLATTAIALALPAAALSQQPATIGHGQKTCLLKPGADCSGVVHRWTVEHHGNLRGINLRKADIRGVDFRGADLRKADLRGSTFRHADLRGANLTGARFGPPTTSRRRANGYGSLPACAPACSGADLENADMRFTKIVGVDFSYANLSSASMDGVQAGRANFSYADLTRAGATQGRATGYAASKSSNFESANFQGATLKFVNFQQQDLSYANMTDANLTGATLSQAVVIGTIWSNTTCPTGKVDVSGCSWAAG